MSLQLAAQHLSAHGRGKDSTLVHMSPKEVNSLNALAKAHGGHLTTNPHTGLPEAGFLESVLPMVAGAALVASGVGAPMAAMLVGGGTTLMTGSLQKGLMAGLGAYGGAELGSGLMASGIDTAAPVVDAQNALIENAKTNFYDPSKGLSPTEYAENFTKTNEALAQNYNNARAAAAPDFMGKIQAMGSGVGSLGQQGGLNNLYQHLGGSPMSLVSTLGSASAPAIAEKLKPKKQEETPTDSDMGQRYSFSMNPAGGTQSGTTTPFPTPSEYGVEQQYFAPSYTKITPTAAKSLYGYADGGTASEDHPTDTPAVQMFNKLQAERAAQQTSAPAIDPNAEYASYLAKTLAPPAQTATSVTATPVKAAAAAPDTNTKFTYDTATQKYTENPNYVDPEKIKNDVSTAFSGGFGGFGPGGGRAAGGSISEAHYNLGGYSDGGRLLRGPGDGVSDSIPAVIGKKQPARLADGEFVVPARIVSELGNGSTEAGARKLYAMMDRIQSARGKTVGKGKVAKNSRSEKYLPA